jgi:hypothetical protein
MSLRASRAPSHNRLARPGRARALAFLVAVLTIGALVFLPHLHTSASLPFASRDLTVLDRTGQTSTYATFQSHNQRAVYVPRTHTLFVADLHGFKGVDLACTKSPPTSTDGCDGTAVVWMTRDGGRTWMQALKLGIGGHYPPALEAGTSGEVYVFVNSYTGSPDTSYVYRLPPHNYLQPYPTPWLTLTGGETDKFTTTYDTLTNRLYYVKGDYTATSSFDLYTINVSAGTFTRRSMLVPDTGRNVANWVGPAGTFPHYPLLYLDRSAPGLLVLAWTNTAPAAPKQYWDIHFILSTDGGHTWLGRSGKISPASFPILADDDGPSWAVPLPRQYRHDTNGCYNTSGTGTCASGTSLWLDTLYAQDGYVFFEYSDNSGHTYFRRYARSTKLTAIQDASSHPVTRVCGGTICLASVGAFFSGNGTSHARLFLTGGMPNHHIGALYTDDDGATWHDYASSSTGTVAFPFAPAGARRVGPGNSVQGAMTDLAANSVDFFSLSRP